MSFKHQNYVTALQSTNLATFLLRLLTLVLKSHRKNKKEDTN